MPQRRFFPSSPSSFPAPQKTCCSNREFSAPLGSLVSFTPDRKGKKRGEKNPKTQLFQASAISPSALMLFFHINTVGTKIKKYIYMGIECFRAQPERLFFPLLSLFCSESVHLFKSSQQAVPIPLALLQRPHAGEWRLTPNSQAASLLPSSFSPHRSLPPSS